MAFATFNVTTDTDAQSSTAGKFVFTDTSDYTGITLTNITGSFTVTYPDGNQYIGSGDINPSSSLTFTLNIPTDSNGDYLEGTYTFLYTVVIGGNVSAGTYSNTVSFKYCKTLPDTATVDLIADCLCAKLSVTDNTSYGSYTTISRLYTVTPPPSLGMSAGVFTSSTFSYTDSPFYTGVYYLTVDVATTYVSTNTVGTVTVKERLEDSSNKIDIQCDIDLCGLTDCINDFRNDVAAEANARGGYAKLPASLSEKVEVINGKLIDFNNNAKCGNSTKAAALYQEIKDLLSCNCGCSSTTNTSRIITPVCGSGGTSANVIVTNTDNNLTVLSVTSGNTTTYTVNLAASTQTLLTTLQSTVNTLTTTVGNLSPKQYYQLTDENYIGDVSNAAGVGIQDLYTFTLSAAGDPENTLEDGDCLKITAGVTFAENTAIKTVYVYVDSTILFRHSVGFVVGQVGNFRQGDMLIEVVIRQKANQVQLVSATANGTASYIWQGFQSQAIDFSASTVLKASAQTAGGTAADITYKFFDVEIFKSA